MDILNNSPWINNEISEVKYYKGLQIHGPLYMHDQIVHFIHQEAKRSNKVHKLRILDIGSGPGALSQALYDAGFEVVSIDINTDFKAKGPIFYKIDLNNKSEMLAFRDKYTSAKFDFIVAAEVIEHIENPWELIRDLKSLCSPDTGILITTPNITSWWSRFIFFIKGENNLFSEENWREWNHINPIAHIEMKQILQTLGFEYVQIYPCGVLPKILTYNWKYVLISILLLPLKFLMKKPYEGWSLLYYAKRRKDS